MWPALVTWGGGRSPGVQDFVTNIEQGEWMLCQVKNKEKIDLEVRSPCGNSEYCQNIFIISFVMEKTRPCVRMLRGVEQAGEKESKRRRKLELQGLFCHPEFCSELSLSKYGWTNIDNEGYFPTTWAT